MESRVWLVTGSAGGLGRKIAEAVLAAGRGKVLGIHFCVRSGIGLQHD